MPIRGRSPVPVRSPPGFWAQDIPELPFPDLFRTAALTPHSRGPPTPHSFDPCSTPDTPGGVILRGPLTPHSPVKDFRGTQSMGSLTSLYDDDGGRDLLLSTMRAELAADPEIMRSVSWTTVLSRAGAQLRAGPQGDPAAALRAFERSSPAKTYDIFLSHSWHANSTVKTLAVLQKLNGCAADTLGVCAAFAMASLDLVGVLPAWAASVDAGFFNLWCPGGPARLDLRGWATLGFVVVRAATLLSWHSLDFRRRRQRCFVDKICIHQTDMELKQHAVNFIGHFLMQTQELLVMLDVTYLQRVWCVFELATFLGLNQDLDSTSQGKLVICPSSIYCTNALIPGMMGMFWLGMYGSLWLGIWAWFIDRLQLLMSDQLVLGVLMLPVIFPLEVVIMVLLRMFQRSYRKIEEMLEVFSLADARCSLESDRQFVLARVADLYGSVDTFEVFAKLQVHSSLRRLLGPTCEITFVMCFRAVVLPSLVVCIDLMLMMEEASLSYRLHFVSGVVVLMILWLPCFLKLLDVAAEISLQISQERDLPAACIGGFLLSTVSTTVLSNARYMLGEDIAAKVTSMVVLSLLCAALWGRRNLAILLSCLKS